MGPLQQDELPTLLETDGQVLAKLVEGMLQGPADHTGGAPNAATHPMPNTQLSVQGGRAAAWKDEVYHPQPRRHLPLFWERASAGT